MSVFRLYLRYFSLHLRSSMQYKTSFFLTLFGQFMSSFAMFLSVYFLMNRFHRVNGFSMEEVMLCFASILLSFTLAECFARGFDSFPAMLANGEFDRILVRPRGVVMQTLASKLALTRLGRLIQTGFVFVWVIPNCGVRWDAARVMTLFLMIAGGVLFFGGMFLLSAGICFFTTESIEFINIFTNGGQQFGSYPLSIYGESVLRLTTFVVPLACVQYYPLLFLIGRTENVLCALCPLAAALFILPCYGFWRFGLRHYRSTGS